jgi:hypothetical protein
VQRRLQKLSGILWRDRRASQKRARTCGHGWGMNGTIGYLGKRTCMCSISP